MKNRYDSRTETEKTEQMCKSAIIRQALACLLVIPASKLRFRLRDSLTYSGTLTPFFAADPHLP